MTDLLEVAQCVSCGQWRATEQLRMVSVKPSDAVAYSCKACYLAMKRAT